MRRALWLFISLAAAGGVACSDGGSSPTGTGGSGGSAGTGSGGNAGTGSGGTTGSAGSGGSSGTSGGFLNAATCGERGMATVNATSYMGYAEFFIIGEAGLGTDVCAVRFDVNRVGAAPAGCTDCNWSHQVQFTNPTVTTNVDGACDANDAIPAIDAAGRAALTGSKSSRGFSKITGHGDALMKYDDMMKMWIEVGRGNWDQPTSSLGYNITTGNCSYGR